MRSEVRARMRRSVDLPPVWTSVLAVTAHPDDATSGLGAVLDAFIVAGASVEVLCLTHGEAWELRGAPGDVAALRGASRASAADVLGAIRAQLPHRPDGVVDSMPQTTLATTVIAAADSCHPDGLLVLDNVAEAGRLDDVAATSAGLLAAQTLGLPVLGWTLSDAVAAQLSQESGISSDSQAQDVDLRVTLDRARQRLASRADTTPSLPGSPRRRQLSMLAESQSLRWLRPPGAVEDS